MQIYVSAFPDLHFDIDQIFGQGDYVMTRWTATGTQRG
jgi:predicted ester cyclase